MKLFQGGCYIFISDDFEIYFELTLCHRRLCINMQKVHKYAHMGMAIFEQRQGWKRVLVCI